MSDYIWMLDHLHLHEHYNSNDLTSWITDLREFGANCVINNCDPETAIEKCGV